MSSLRNNCKKIWDKSYRKVNVYWTLLNENVAILDIILSSYENVTVSEQYTKYWPKFAIGQNLAVCDLSSLI